MISSVKTFNKRNRILSAINSIKKYETINFRICFFSSNTAIVMLTTKECELFRNE